MEGNQEGRHMVFSELSASDARDGVTETRGATGGVEAVAASEWGRGDPKCCSGPGSEAAEALGREAAGAKGRGLLGGCWDLDSGATGKAK